MNHKNVTVKVGEVIKNYGVMIIYKLVSIYEFEKNYKSIESYRVIRNDKLRKKVKPWKARDL